ncbi:MAG: undecaprenyl-diphosphatase UppP [Clostridium sp.]|nr:undecaprenyl-diphosphatase UppP [Clostridium sp.]
MNLIQAIIMGLMQGLTEFLPVSSSGHLVLSSSLYKYFTHKEFVSGSSEEVVFDIILHLGTLLAVFLFFKDDIIKITKAFVNACLKRDFSDSEAKLALFILIGTVFTVFVAFPLKIVSENLINLPYIVGIFIFITGCILYFGEWVSEKKAVKTDKVDLKTAIIIGIAQGIASIPGISRSGSTISTGIFLGLDRVSCARYSFLLSVPIIVGASIFYPVLEVDFHEFLNYNWLAFVVGFLVSFVSGYFCIKYFLKFLGKHSMKIFAYYCWIAGASMFVFFKFFA